MKALSTILALTALTATPALAGDNYVIQTGSDGGAYEHLGRVLGASITREAERKGIHGFDYEVRNSNGSLENIECLNQGECQLVIAQADALNVLAPTVPFKAKTAHAETVFWLYNTKNGYKDLEDIEGKKDIRMVIVDDSGAMVTMQSFVSADQGYATNLETAILADDLYDAVDIVCEGKENGKKVAGVLYVGGSLPAETRQDFASCVSVGQATDGDFDDAKDPNGDKLYRSCDIPRAKYSPMKGSNTFSDENTVCVDAMVVYSTEGTDRKLKVVIKKGINKVLRSK